VVGRSEAEAMEKFDYLQSLIDPVVGVALLSTILGDADLSGCPLDGPLPDIALATNSSQGTFANVVDLARRENLTIRQLYQRLAGARGKLTITGSVARVVDQMEEWFCNGAADGFVIQPSYLPGALDDFVELVIPELQRRGLFRTDYEGGTLRENLGLPRPASRYADGGAQRQESTVGV
jgi:alkanesulfonate monooxygenase SsuD/methylene tetrahydromethanopterin reductase-like flavin-dependent oxidoreductase (luciferase family)